MTISPRSYNQITEIMSIIETTQIQYGAMHLRKQDIKRKEKSFESQLNRTIIKAKNDNRDMLRSRIRPLLSVDKSTGTAINKSNMTLSILKYSFTFTHHYQNRNRTSSISRVRRRHSQNQNFSDTMNRKLLF